jgi:hypothetical protein
LAPTVTSVDVPTDGTYKPGDNLDFIVNFDEDLTVTNTSTILGLTMGVASGEAVYSSHTTNSVTYRYTVQAGDEDTNGITTGTITLNTTTITDGLNNADVTLNGVPSTTGILIDGVAPVNSGGQPTISTITTDGFTVNAQTDENSTVYYVVVADGAGAPSSAQVKAGNDSLDAAATASGNIATTGGVTNTDAVTGLSHATAYDIYIVAEDAYGNIQASPTKLDTTTLNDAPVNNRRYNNIRNNG